MLSNVYLHYVLDQWFAQEVKPRLKGRAFMTRFADDAVMGFEFQEDAEKVLRVLPKRFGKYSLTIHPEKTRLVAFGRPRSRQGKKPGTFDFLGFTHYWGKSRQGKGIIKRKTARQRLSRGLKRIAEWCRHNRHRPIVEQHRELCQKVRGHFAYYGITGNDLWLRKYREGVKRLWQKWLHRRSRSSTDMPWDRVTRLLQRYRLPPIKIVHSIYTAKPGPEEPGALMALVRVCGGAVRVTCGSTRIYDLSAVVPLSGGFWIDDGKPFSRQDSSKRLVGTIDRMQARGVETLDHGKM